jgi:hypothetical protein
LNQDDLSGAIAGKPAPKGFAKPHKKARNPMGGASFCPEGEA